MPPLGSLMIKWYRLFFISMSSTPEYHEPEASHRPFRAWALQHDLSSLLGGSADWRVNADQLGLEADEDPAAGLNDQGFLRAGLAIDQRIPLRIKMSITLWLAALITDILNQVLPIGLHMPTNAFWITIALVLFPLTIATTLYPGMSPERFVIVEQCILTYATLVIIYQCSTTGGSDSPYLIWFLLTTYYAAYLLPANQARLNIASFIGMIAATALLDASSLSSMIYLQLIVLTVVVWLLGLALIRQRSSEESLERAVGFMALADPLTSTANTRSFEQYLNELTRMDGQRLAVIVVDLNGLKGANAVFGHDTGDGMVVRTARLMLKASGPDDQVARFGGGEFGVVIPDASPGDVNRWNKEFSMLVERHNDAVRGQLPQISVATGSAQYPDDGVTPAELIDAADSRLQHSKSVAVVPPHELEGGTFVTAGHALQSARFADAPKTPVDARERMRFASLNWFTSGILAVGVALIGGPHVYSAAAIACGALGIVAAAVTFVFRYRPLTRTAMYGLDIATMIYPFPFIAVTGSAESPLLVMTCLPVAFYAQNYPLRPAAIRIGLILIGFSAGFWLAGNHGPTEVSWYSTSLAAILVIAGVMQYSSGVLTAGLQEIRETATIDKLTGLNNVYALRRDLEHALAQYDGRDESLAPGVVLLDLDDFRNSNSVAGHSGGDEVLIDVAERLKLVAGRSPAYRVEGDEFAVLVRGLTGRALATFAQRCGETVAHKRVNGAGSIAICASVGHAAWTADATAESMMEQAGSVVRGNKSERRDAGPPGRPILL